jgi:hypothetical protein
VFLAGRFDIALRALGLRPSYDRYYHQILEQPGWPKARAALIRLGQYGREHSIPMLLVNHPIPAELHHYPLQAVTDHAREAAAAANLDFLDLLSAYAVEPDESRLWVTRADRHPNGHANGLAAEALFEYLRASEERVEERRDR